MSLVGRFQMLTNLYRNGTLCNCWKKEKVIVGHAKFGNVYREEIIHREHCIGRAKIMAVLQDTEDKNVKV